MSENTAELDIFFGNRLVKVRGLAGLTEEQVKRLERVGVVVYLYAKAREKDNFEFKSNNLPLIREAFCSALEECWASDQISLDEMVQVAKNELGTEEVEAVLAGDYRFANVDQHILYILLNEVGGITNSELTEEQVESLERVGAMVYFYVKAREKDNFEFKISNFPLIKEAFASTFYRLISGEISLGKMMQVAKNELEVEDVQASLNGNYKFLSKKEFNAGNNTVRSGKGNDEGKHDKGQNADQRRANANRGEQRGEGQREDSKKAIGGDSKKSDKGLSFMRNPRDGFDPLEFSNAHPILSKTPFLGFLCLVVDAFRVGKKVISETSKHGSLLESIKANSKYILPPTKEYLSAKWLDRVNTGESVVNEITLAKQHRILAYEVFNASEGLAGFVADLAYKATKYAQDLISESADVGKDVMARCEKDIASLKSVCLEKCFDISALCKKLNGIKAKGMARLTLGTEILERIAELNEEMKQGFANIQWNSNYIRSRMLQSVRLQEFDRLVKNVELTNGHYHAFDQGEVIKEAEAMYPEVKAEFDKASDVLSEAGKRISGGLEGRVDKIEAMLEALMSKMDQVVGKSQRPPEHGGDDR
ncbi:hypothetical protein [Helicobacter suis]|uniref:hypothetical protein n=1 Tax=Helicobacter suis TaxID=104628 RepID=UPI0013D696D0|nr:hypothetical protein [Helicobacter suis]